MKIEETKKSMTAGDNNSKENKKPFTTYNKTLSSAYYNFNLSEKTPVFRSMEFENTGTSPISFWPVFNGNDWSSKAGIKTLIQKQHPAYPTIDSKEIPMLVWKFISTYRHHWYPATGDKWLHNPLHYFNIFGYGFCDDSAQNTEFILETLFSYPASTARVWKLSGHVVPECNFDGSWKILDSDVTYYTQNSKLLSQADLAGEYNWVIKYVHNSEIYANMYSSTSDNTINNHNWTDDTNDLRHTLNPGEKLIISRLNSRKYYSVLYPQEPPDFSHVGEGRIIIDKLKDNLSFYDPDDIAVSKDGEIYATDTTGTLEINLKTPYLFTGITAEIVTTEKMNQSYSISCNDSLVYENDGSTNTLIDIGAIKNISHTWPPTQSAEIEIELSPGQKIKSINVMANFQISNYTLPRLRSSNQLYIKTANSVNLNMKLAVSDPGECRAVTNVFYDSASNTINWKPVSGVTPNSYRLSITKDKNGLYPIQPLVTEQKAINKEPCSVDLNAIPNISYFMANGQACYFKVDSIYDNNIVKSSALIPVTYKAKLAQVEDWK